MAKKRGSYKKKDYDNDIVDQQEIGTEEDQVKGWSLNCGVSKSFKAKVKAKADDEFRTIGMVIRMLLTRWLESTTEVKELREEIKVLEIKLEQRNYGQG